MFWAVFTFRAAAGLFFSGLLWARGLGLAVAAHFFYDTMATLANLGG